MKPYRTLRQLLVHPKDQRTVEQTGECVYRIPCHNCDCTYIGETGRNYGKRQEEHRKEVESISNRTQGSRNEQVSHNRSCSERKSCHKLVRCQNFGKRKTSENKAGQGIDQDPERTHLHEQRWRGVQLTDSL